MDNPKNRRIFERINASFQGKLQKSRFDFGSFVSLNDISAEGIRFTTDQTVNINDDVSLVINMPELDETITIKGKITWIKNAGEKSWEVGLNTKKMQFMQMQRLFDLAKKKKTKHY